MLIITLIFIQRKEQNALKCLLALPVFLNALTGNGVHVVTVNDYLSKRDSELMGPLYQFHGLSVDCIDKHQPNSDARRRAYMLSLIHI